MTSSPVYTEAFVWVWLPSAVDPIVAGKIEKREKAYVFFYGNSYLDNKDAIPLHETGLPLEEKEFEIGQGGSFNSCLRDAAPDAWGRRVIINERMGRVSKFSDPTDFDELVYLLESGSDRIGAIDFQLSATEYIPRTQSDSSLDDLMQSADRIAAGEPLSEDLAAAIQHGTSIGGARPKATLKSDSAKYIAKFSLSTDLYDIVKAEFIAMRLAAHPDIGINVSAVSLEYVAGRSVLLVKRFDRQKSAGSWERRGMLSALTLLNLPEEQAAYASYEDLCFLVRKDFDDAENELKELFCRLVFNILVGNTDDHARNHAAFWNGKTLALTPAYDICPMNRAGGEASQAMFIHGQDRSSRVSTCIAAAGNFLLSENDANEIIDTQIRCIVNNWDDICDEANLAEVDKRLLWRRSFLNPYSVDYRDIM